MSTRWTSSSHQRQGIGRRLMQAVIDRATGERLTNLTLTTSCETPWNVPFYRSLGFVVLDEDALPLHLADTLAREGSRRRRSRPCSLSGR
jgi:GNAT superfamily N-acetyltransferase